MDRSQRQLIRQLFELCRELPPAERAIRLASDAVQDCEVENEVRALLSAYDRSAEFLEEPVLQRQAHVVERAIRPSMQLARGTRVGRYIVVEPIGAGGMGIVYRASDTDLGRDVALKLLPAELADDPARRARLQAEARALAALNHPNIAAIHGVEDGALVMELVYGSTLEERLQAGPIPLDEALQIATQMAEALEAAHEHGIIHRDLKPANVKITPEGIVKLLDFGLAKSSDTGPGDKSPDISPPFLPAMTVPGMILGTVGYMAPEQAAGKSVDKRADVWAFGVVLFELLSRKRLFEGESETDTLTRLMREDIDLGVLPSSTPPQVGELLHRCLERNPKRRLRDIGEARIVLGDLASGAISSERVPSSAAETGGLLHRRGRIAWIAALAMTLIAIGASSVAIRHLREGPPGGKLVRFRLDFPDGVTVSPTTILAFSPDGTRIALLAASGQKNQIWLHNLDSSAPHPLPGTEGAASGPIFSPDGHSLAFMKGSGLWRIDLASCATQSLCELCGEPDSWSRDGVILLDEKNVIKQISASGGITKPVTELAAGETGHFAASFLPDGRHFLYNSLEGFSISKTFVGSIEDPKFRKSILQGAGQARYTSPGWLLFSRCSVLFAQRFDANRLELSCVPAAVTQPVAGSWFLPGYAYSASETDSLTWRTGSARTSMELTWFDRTGKELGSVGQLAEIANPVLSRDGKRVLITIRDPATKTRDVWILDLTRGASSRLTFDPAEDHNPVWSPDGAYVFFTSKRRGHSDIFRKRADGVGADEELLVSDVDKGVDSPSPDGKSLLFNVQGQSRASSIWLLPLTGDRKPTPIVTGPYVANFPQFSPDGRWIAYMSQESGRDQVFVRSAPDAGLPAAKWQVSIVGGTMPQWRRDGKELFFLEGDKLMAAPVRSHGTVLDFGNPVQLFTTRRGVSLRNHFTVSDDGQRFLFASPRDTSDAGQVHVLLNWPALLTKN